jgi:hypothetical protein
MACIFSLVNIELCKVFINAKSGLVNGYFSLEKALVKTFSPSNDFSG